MENKEEKQTSLKYFYDKVLDATEYYNSDYHAILDALNKAKKMYAEEIIKAFNDGCLKGYNDHVKVINDLNRYA